MENVIYDLEPIPKKSHHAYSWLKTAEHTVHYVLTLGLHLMGDTRKSGYPPHTHKSIPDPSMQLHRLPGSSGPDWPLWAACFVTRASGVGVVCNLKRSSHLFLHWCQNGGCDSHYVRADDRKGAKNCTADLNVRWFNTKC